MVAAYIVSQCFALGAFIAGLLSFQYQRKGMLLLSALACVLNAIHFFVLERPAAGMLALLIAIRVTTFVYSSKRSLLYLFLIVTLVAGIYCYKDLYSLFALVATFLGTLVTFSREERFMRKGMMLCTIIWMIHNTLIGSIVAVAMEGSFLISNVYAYARRYRRVACHV